MVIGENSRQIAVYLTFCLLVATEGLLCTLWLSVVVAYGTMEP